MKKNNPRKPFFSEDKKDFDSPKRPDFSPKGSKFGKSDSKSDFKGKSFGKKEDSFDKKPFRKKSEDQPSFGDKPKGRFFKEEGKTFGKPAFDKRNEAESGGRKPFGEKRFDKSSGEPKKWEKREDQPFGKKTYGEKPDRFKKEGFSEKKFSSRKPDFEKPYGERPERTGKGDFSKNKFSKGPKSDFDKPYKKDFSGEKSSPEKGEKLVYKGRGRDQKPIFGVEEKRFNPEGGNEKRGFGKKHPKRVELNPDRPDYNFDNLPQKKNKKESEDLLRLNKYIANSGICSRREADDLIAKGLVTVNGEVITEMGYKVKKTDRVVFEGKKINPEKPVYVLLNKPKDFITTTEDPMERKTVMKLVENACEERIFPVGRLDRNTTGLLLFTNDGELAAKLSHPSNEIKKIYQVTLDKPLTHKDEEAILEGLTLEDGDAKVDDMQVLSKDRTILGLEIHIGRNRIVRRIFAHLGYEVIALDRVMYAGLDKKDLKRGHYRFLTEQEVIRLKYYI
ncbi:pseudouridine synthase [Algoriphagus sp. AK58]|uniref:pseudouridine synthase n=1 Tax=Algoriphagus sp. AK58 TaxID=1406877 RepID=UPI001650ABC0|nr:pseudouridine synthase [Algoriphagus sp. AK58]MBC6366305.1 pseudouridine synthase [Algoriphagus sp. AK58]